jgi:hypothetical protein
VLTIQIAGGRGEPERVLLVARPVGDRVRVREWNAAGTADTSTERDCSIDEVMALVTRAAREHRRVSEDPFTIRRWLGVQLG